MYMQEEAHLFGSFFNFVENNAVGLIYLYLSSVHDKQSVLQIHRKESHRIRLMIQGDEMPVVREKVRILRIIAARCF